MGFGTQFGHSFGIDEPLGEVIDFVITGGEIVSSAGGEVISIGAGTFTQDSDLQVFIGPNGDITDAPAYAGAGTNQGYNPQSSDGATLQVISPPLDKGVHHMTIVDGVSIFLVELAITVVERNWPSKFVNVRGNFPPWQSVGRLRLETEDLD